MSTLNINNFPVNFIGASYQLPEKGKVRSHNLRNLYAWTTKKVREFGQYFLQNQIFRACSSQFKSKMNEERLEESREILRMIGGVSVVLENPDGTRIEAMYFDVELFKEIILARGGHFVESKGDRFHTLRSYTPELTQLLTKMKFVQLGSPDPEFHIPRPKEKAPLVGEKRPGVTIITQGNSCIFEMNRKEISETLLTGQSCMVFNIQGTGRSTGRPTEDSTYQDIETVYQFLKFKGFADPHITVKGYCLGGGQAAELAKRHPINISLDRTFSSVSEIVGQTAAGIIGHTVKKIPFLKKFSKPIKRVLGVSIEAFVNRFVISYSVQLNLKKAKGHVHITDATDDQLIPKGTGDRLFAGAKPPPSKIKSRLVLKDGEHCSVWEDEHHEDYADHLNRAKLLRDFGHTATDASLLSETISYIGKRSGVSAQGTATHSSN